VTIAILWFAGASAMAGLLHLIPRYLPRFGMAPRWVAYRRPLVLVLFAVAAIVTLVFNASVEAQGAAYATGVLVLMLSGSLAVALTLGRENSRRLAKYFWLVTAIFAYTLVDNVIERPEGVIIATVFIVTVLTIGSISGGNRYNVVADSVEMQGTVRTFSADGPQVVKTKMEAILKGVTSAYGASYELNYFTNAPVTLNEPALAAASTAALKTVFGDKVVTPQLQMVSEDFSYYQQQMPGFYFFVGVKNEAKGITAMWHTEFYEMDEAALPIGVRALSNVVLDYLFR
jgi:hypothetical protein